MFVTCIFVLFTTDFSLSAGTFNWTAPPPAWTPTDGNDIRTVHFPVLNGSTNVALRWNYVLGGRERLVSITWIFKGNQVALLTTVPSAIINDDRFAVNTSEVATLIIKNVSDITDGTIRCVAQTSVNPWKYNIQVEITVPPKIISTGDSQIVTEGSELVLFCNATGKPQPNITWTRVLDGGTDSQELFVGSPWIIININRTATGTYRCTADNGIGGPVNHTISANILYKPSADQSRFTTTLELGEDKSIACPVDLGNPPAVITWYKGNDTSGNKTTNGSTLEIQNALLSDEGWSTCFAKNHLGNATVSLFLEVVQPVPSTASTPSQKTPEVEMSHDVTATIRGVTIENCTEITPVFIDKCCDFVDACVDGQEKNCSNGSIIIDFILRFSRQVKVSDVLSTLRDAAKNSKFGDLKVVAESIRAIVTPTEATSTKHTTMKVPDCEESILKDENCKIKVVTIIIIVILLLLFIAVTSFTACYIHKKRKCRKDTRVCDSDGQPLSSNHSTLSEGNRYAEVSSGYAKSGPQPSGEIDIEEQLRAVGGEGIPTYAVVDKSKKKDKKKGKKAAELKPTEDQYAVVDKSKKKKKKKNEPDATYAEVDMSKSSKKKQQPGEALYADLGEFHKMQKMPEVSTSPKALSPIKMPQSYAETQYADITQFLQGNPEDAGAELRKDSTTPAVSNTATSSKEKSSAGITGDGSEATNETGF